MKANHILAQDLHIALEWVCKEGKLNTQLENILKKIVKCLDDHHLAIDVLENQCVEKVSPYQLEIKLARKLDVSEYLSSIGKMERVVQGLQNYSDQHLDNLTNRINSQISQGISNNIIQQNKQLHKMQQQIKELREEVQKVSGSELVEEIQAVQEYCEENKCRVDELIQQQRQQHALYQQINQSIQAPTQTKLLWHIQPHETLPAFIPKWTTQYVSIEGHAVYIQKAGIYHIVCGFLPYSPTTLTLTLDNKPIIHHTCTDLSTTTCRTLMLYFQVQQGGELVLECEAGVRTQGFLMLQSV